MIYPSLSKRPFPVTVKHPVYPWELPNPKGKRTTTTAGFLANGGVLLCADTELSGGVKRHEAKIFRHDFAGGMVVFSVAGHFTNADMAIRQCRYSLRPSGDPYSEQQVEEALRDAMASIYDKYVAQAPPDEKEAARFELIIAVRMDGCEPSLFVAENRGLLQVSNFACRGSGMYLGEYIIGQTYDPFMPMQNAVVTAMQVLSATKRYCEGVSGPSQFMTVFKNGESDIMSRDFDVAEYQIAMYEQAVGALLLGIGNVGTDRKFFKKNLLSFTGRVTKIRDAWEKAASTYMNFVRGLTLADRPIPTPPKRGRKRQRP